MPYWKPTDNIYLPIEHGVIHHLEGPYAFLHPGYMGENEIHLEGHKFLMAEGLYAWSCAHAFYACLMLSRRQAIDVIKSSTVQLARERALFYGPRKDWTLLSNGLMEDIIYSRYSTFHAKNMLISTRPYAIMPYINKGSLYWGCTITSYGYTGFNLIGKALMRYRSWLKR